MKQSGSYPSGGIRLHSDPVILALGSNLGDRRTNLARGLQFLSGEVEIEVVSRVVESEPWGPVQQGPFLNLVLRGHTRLDPRGLLGFLLEAERAAGRVRSVRFGPRPLDVDLIFFGAITLDDPDLTIPHPRWSERPFVASLLPDVVGDLVEPVSGRGLMELLPTGHLPEGLTQVASIEWRDGARENVPVEGGAGRASGPVSIREGEA